MITTPAPQKWVVDAVVATLKKFVIKVATIDDIDYHQVLAARTGAQKQRYARAIASLEREVLGKFDTTVRMFVKFEKAPVADLADKAPRAIQFRSPRYVVELARYLMPLEKFIFRKRAPGRVAFAKGLNSFERAQALHDGMMRVGPYTKFLLLDHSRFDAHLSKEWLEVEHHVENELCRRPELAQLLKLQYRNRGVTTNGLRYWSEARKMSGEYNTSLGGNIINYGLLKTWCPDPSYVLCDGDDGVIIIKDDRQVPDIDWFYSAGFKTKLEVVSNFGDILFCQTKPIEYMPGLFRMVREPGRLISRASFTIRSYNGKAWLGYYAALGKGELAMNCGIPVLQAFALALIRFAQGAKPVKLEGWDFYKYTLEPSYANPVPMPIHSVARNSFAASFGISIVEQLRWEALLSTWDIGDHIGRLLAFKR